MEGNHGEWRQLRTQAALLGNACQSVHSKSSPVARTFRSEHRIPNRRAQDTDAENRILEHKEAARETGALAVPAAPSLTWRRRGAGRAAAALGIGSSVSP